jgi:hypothetical protein
VAPQQKEINLPKINKITTSSSGLLFSIKNGKRFFISFISLHTVIA